MPYALCPIPARTPHVTEKGYSYIAKYIELHRRYFLDVSVAIAFWYGAPAKRKQRLQLESELIYKWRSPFNKECWQWWGQRFGK
ncbi:hypothetical protein [Microcoleus sp. herbarium2]|uniref:hypothetical protein n=1 Tax=Microcoleus sp. herbarium2 TaxID=3055433 RepID=UPI002FD445E5